MRTRLAFALAVVAACGGDDTTAGPDAAPYSAMPGRTMSKCACGNRTSPALLHT